MQDQKNKQALLNESYIKERAKSRHLFDDQLKNAELFCYIKKFVDLDIGESFNQFEPNDQAKVIKCVFATLHKFI